MYFRKEGEHEWKRHIHGGVKGFSCDLSSQYFSFGSVCFQDVLTDAIVSDLAADVEHFFAVYYILQNFPIFNKKLAAEILMVANDIFNDVEETTHLRELCEMDWIVKSFWHQFQSHLHLIVMRQTVIR